MGNVIEPKYLLAGLHNRGANFNDLTLYNSTGEALAAAPESGLYVVLPVYSVTVNHKTNGEETHNQEGQKAASQESPETPGQQTQGGGGNTAAQEI